MNATGANYNTTGTQSNRDTSGTSTGADFPTDPTGSGNASQPSAFQAGLAELVNAPVAFLSDLFGGQGSYTPKVIPTVGDSISTFGEDFVSAPGQLAGSVFGDTPTWAKVAIIGGIVVVGLIAVHSLLKDV